MFVGHLKPRKQQASAPESCFGVFKRILSRANVGVDFVKGCWRTSVASHQPTHSPPPT